MNAAPTTADIALRVALTLVAGFLIGFNRGEHGRPAGIRTTMLVCLAASLAMLQANFLLESHGKASDSFVNIDPMRLALGILTGVGFIGAGAILKRNDLVIGLTTAATLWFVTVIGLCFGGGQIELGLIGTVLGIVILWGLKYLEAHLQQDLTGFLTIEIDPAITSDAAIRDRLNTGGLSIRNFAETFDRSQPLRQRFTYTVEWKGPRNDVTVPAAISDLHDAEGIRSLSWHTRASA